MNYNYIHEILILTFSAIPVTLKITFISMLMATLPAFGMALCKIKNIKILTQIINIYISFIRAVPSILLILIVYSLVPSMLNALFKLWGIAINIFALDHIIYAYIVFTFIALGLLTEIFRSALLSVNLGEFEAALAIGMKPWQAYMRIVIPQAFGTAIPSICNLTVGIIKASSLVFLMGIQDITAVAKIAAAEYYAYIEAYAAVFIVYLLVCGITQLCYSCLEKYVCRYKEINLKKETTNCYKFGI